MRRDVFERIGLLDDRFGQGDRNPAFYEGKWGEAWTPHRQRVNSLPAPATSPASLLG